MEFKYRAVDGRPPTVSTVPGVFSDQLLRYGCLSDSGARPMAAVDFDGMSARPYIDREEIERENREIRNDLLALRRRMREATLRREMMFEREMVLRGGGSVHFAYDDRSIMLLDPRYPMMTRHSDFSLVDDWWMVPRSSPSDNIPLHRPQDNLSFDLNPLPNKDRMIVLPKPDPNLLGAKRKAESKSPAIDTTESPMAGLAKKPKSRWVCALCEVSVTSEKVLNDHLQGKKHWLKEAELRGEEIDTSLAKDKGSSGNAKDEGSASHYKPKESAGASGKNHFKKDTRKTTVRSPVASGDRKATVSGPAMNGASGKRKFTYWCEMCQVGAFSPVVFASHEKGKKHFANLLELGKSNNTD